MAELEYVDFSWFTSMPPQDQQTLMADPSLPFSQAMTNRLKRVPGLWWYVEHGNQVLLSSQALAQLEAARNQFDYWWENRLDDADRDYITQHRNGDLDGSYAKKVKAANETELGEPPHVMFVLVTNPKDNNSFQLPQMIRVYVETKTQD